MTDETASADVAGTRLNGQKAEAGFVTNTLKRNPKMDMSKVDLLQMLSYLEGELQARDVALASLKMEQVKQMLSRAKYGWSDVSDPVIALQRDSEIVKDVESEDAAIRGIYGNQLTQLEHLINTQRVSQQQMRDQLIAVERQYHRTCAELSEIKQKHDGEIELAENVTCLLEKDRDRYKTEAEALKARSEQLDIELSAAKENQSEDKSVVAKHRQIALVLLRERSRLVMKLLESRERCAELERTLKDERERSSTLEENVERHVSECEQLCTRLASAESLNRVLQLELDGLRTTAPTVQTISQETADIVTDSASRQKQPIQSQLPARSVTVLEGRNTSGKMSPRIPAETNAKYLRSPESSIHQEDAASSSVERWATPINRNIAAARLRSVLSAAIESSATTGSPVAEAGIRLSGATSQSLPAAFQHSGGSPHLSSQPSLTASKLPQVTSTIHPSALNGSHSIQRSTILPPANSSAVSVHLQPVTDVRPADRLTPLMPVSPRLAPIVVSSSQNNGMVTKPLRGSNITLKPLNNSSK